MRAWFVVVFAVACSGTSGSAIDAPGPAPDAPVTRTHTLYLSFDGVTLAAGSADDATQNISSLATGPTTLSPYLGSGSNRDAVITADVSEVATILAPYDVDVVMVPPSSGPYMMIVTTDTDSSVLGCTDCPAAVPADCGAELSPVAFNFGAGSALPQHGFSADTVAMLGLSVLGIPESAVPDDCMCYHDANCTFPPDRQCKIGGAGTAISATSPGCSAGSATVMNEAALFLAGFGPHP